jgi:mono/diheme cytochrome c family protein
VSKWAVVLIAAAGLCTACNRAASAGAKPSDSAPQPSPMTAVEGPSWLKHLGITMSDTRMGQMGGSGIIPATARREPEIGQQSGVGGEQFELTGADLYRIDCRSCHGADGRGAPPEIHSLIGPVQGASPALIQRRMAARGAPISEQMAAQMASEAQKAIRDRLQNGGEKMPAFSYLRPDEVAALLAYLGKLAGVSGRGHVAVVSESAAHVGELVIKGTCHTCHDATGPGGGRMMMMRGIIPSLASLPYDYSLSSVIGQVQYGSSGMMMMMGGDRMPPFPYFTNEELAAAYFYLQAYPPPR